MLKRKLLRTALRYKAQFISMILMVTLGIGVFLGFNIEWYSLDRDTSALFEATKFADYRIYNEAGFTAEDLEAIKAIDGVETADRVVSVNVSLEGTDKKLGLFSVEHYDLSLFYTTSGADYDPDGDGFWLSDRFAEENGISVGDTLTVSYRGIDISGRVEGLGKSGEFMICVADENQIMPDFTNYGFVYATPDSVSHALGAPYYPQINLISDLEKEELEKAVSAALDETTLVLSKDENRSYAGARSEIEEGVTMGNILPLLFLMIGILTMITTMHRITANEKTQIGTLKALGFRDRRILAHYTSYGCAIGLIGTVFGVLLGYGLAYMIVSPHGMQSTYMDLPDWSLHMPAYCWFVLAGAILLLTFIGFLSVKKMLSGTAAEALRPYAPKAMKPLPIEKTRLWEKLSFTVRWNVRDVTRHKSRSLMTLIGVVGCMILMIGGLGMRDTMSEYLDMIDNKMYNYTTKINLAENADAKTVDRLAGLYEADRASYSSVSVDGRAVSLEVYGIEHDMIRFVDKNGRRVDVGDDGAYICMRLADDYGIGDVIEVSPYGASTVYRLRVAGIVQSPLTENVVISEKYAEQENLPYKVTTLFTDTDTGGIQKDDAVASTQSKRAIMDSYGSFLEILNFMVGILVAAAVVLGIVVLYNLGVMSYVERYHELATLKVVGFNDRHVGKILISQNVWLTLIGVVLGIPAGYGVLEGLVVALASEYELTVYVGFLSYLISVLLTFGVSLLVGLIISKKNKKIDMVEALKSNE